MSICRGRSERCGARRYSASSRHPVRAGAVLQLRQACEERRNYFSPDITGTPAEPKGGADGEVVRPPSDESGHCHPTEEHQVIALPSLQLTSRNFQP